jgi:hypothetical protein
MFKKHPKPKKEEPIKVAAKTKAPEPIVNKKSKPKKEGT